MMNDEKNRESANKEEEIRIDYENIDVADIMDQIKSRIARKPKTTMEKNRGVESHPAPSAYIPDEPPELPGAKGKARRLLFKIMKPFSPLIKLLILPVYEEFRESFLILDRTNRRLDYLSSTMNDIDQRHNIIADEIKESLYKLKNDMDKRNEYTKLLHSLSHNIVVELSKLKIEHEDLKLKTRILEKDFEYLGKREKALEKHIVR